MSVDEYEEKPGILEPIILGSYLADSNTHTHTSIVDGGSDNEQLVILTLRKFWIESPL